MRLTAIKNLNKKVTSNKTKHLLVENEFKKLETFDSSLFIDQSYFNSDGAQLYLIFQLLYYILKRLGDTEKTISWKCKGLSDEKLTTTPRTDNSLSSTIKWYKDSRFCLKFNGSCLKQRNASYTPRNRIMFSLFMN